MAKLTISLSSSVVIVPNHVMAFNPVRELDFFPLSHAGSMLTIHIFTMLFLYKTY